MNYFTKKYLMSISLLLSVFYTPSPCYSMDEDSTVSHGARLSLKDVFSKDTAPEIANLSSVSSRRYYYTLKNKDTTLKLDSNDGGSVYTLPGPSDYQRWYVEEVGDRYYTFENFASHRRLDTNGDWNGGGEVYTHSPVNNNNQKWMFLEWTGSNPEAKAIIIRNSASNRNLESDRRWGDKGNVYTSKPTNSNTNSQGWILKYEGYTDSV